MRINFGAQQPSAPRPSRELSAAVAEQAAARANQGDAPAAPAEDSALACLQRFYENRRD